MPVILMLGRLVTCLTSFGPTVDSNLIDGRHIDTIIDIGSWPYHALTLEYSHFEGMNYSDYILVNEAGKN